MVDTLAKWRLVQAFFITSPAPLPQETCKTSYTLLKPNRLYERRLCSVKHETLSWYTSSYNRNIDSNTHWTMIWEEVGHHIFINIENKYKYTFSSSWHLTKPWSGSAVSLLQRTQPPSSATQGKDLQGRGVGKESPDSSSITMQKFKSPLMDLPTSIYMGEIR